MNLKTKVEKLEANAAPEGHCPHLPPIVREFATDGTEQTASGFDGATACACGRERLEIHVHETAMAELQRDAD